LDEGVKVHRKGRMEHGLGPDVKINLRARVLKSLIKAKLFDAAQTDSRIADRVKRRNAPKHILGSVTTVISGMSQPVTASGASTTGVALGKAEGSLQWNRIKGEYRPAGKHGETYRQEAKTGHGTYRIAPDARGGGTAMLHYTPKTGKGYYLKPTQLEGAVVHESPAQAMQLAEAHHAKSKP
jgi:hypothetical protein